jgi:CRP-like cAMP-binding protein
VGGRSSAAAGVAGTHRPKQNRLLAALPASVLERLEPHLELVPMTLGECLYESGDRLRHVYFPTTAIVSVLYVMTDGAPAEIAVVGNEGMVGIHVFMGGEAMPTSHIVQSSGHSYRLGAGMLRQEFSRSGGRRVGALQKLLLCYTQAVMTQVTQTAACNRHHTVEQQLCRWLLSCLDRLPSNELTMTQELIANMLGVRRESVALVAGKLQSAGLITYRRGHITVVDRPSLERRACECYAAVRREYDRLLTAR